MKEKINITLCPKVCGGDIPQYKFKSREKACEFIDDWVYEKDYDKSVLVCFQNWRSERPQQMRNEQISILISHSWQDVIDFTERMIHQVSKKKDIDYAIFEFESYQEAFAYCKDLKESF